jgi:hypothetical protein
LERCERSNKGHKEKFIINAGEKTSVFPRRQVKKVLQKKRAKLTV